MAEIQLRNVSLSYSAPLRDPASRLFEIKRERLQEDLPVETASGVTALDDVNLTIPNGQTFAVVGPSGCGKSTLLRVVAGIVNDYTGQVLYDGEDVQNILPKDRYIGMVFQNYALYPNFNNEGNLSFFFKTAQDQRRGNARAHSLHLRTDGHRLQRTPAAQAWHTIWRTETARGHCACHCPRAETVSPR